MKRISILFLGASLFAALSCNKKTATDSQPQHTSIMAQAKGGSGSGGGGSAVSSTGIIQSFVPGGASRLVATRPDSMLVVFNTPAPAGGYVLSFASSDPAVQPPSTLNVPAGATSQFVVLNSTTVTTARNVTITVSVSGQSRSSTIKLYPLTATIAAPHFSLPAMAPALIFTGR